MKHLVAILSLFLLISCGEKEVIPKPDNLLPEDLYVSLTVEMQLLDAYAYISNDSTSIDSLKEALFEHYQTREELFVASNQYYQSRVGEHSRRIDSALQAIKREQERFLQPPNYSDSDNK